MKIAIIIIASLLMSWLFPSCAYNSPGAKVDNRVTVNTSFMPPTEQILTTR
jgi:hypothetical protein